MTSPLVKVKVTVTLKSVKNWEKCTFLDFFVIFSETMCPKVTKSGIVVVWDKGFEILLHSLALTEGQGHSDLETESKISKLGVVRNILWPNSDTIYTRATQFSMVVVYSKGFMKIIKVVTVTLTQGHSDFQKTGK